MALTYADKSIKRLYDGGPILTDEAREQLYKASNFEELRTILSETFQDQNLEDLQFRDTALALEQWLGSLLNRIKRRESLALEAYHSSKESRHAEKMERLRKKVLAGKSQQEEYLTHTRKCDVCPALFSFCPYRTYSMKLPIVAAASSCFWRVAWV